MDGSCSIPLSLSQDDLAQLKRHRNLGDDAQDRLATLLTAGALEIKNVNLHRKHDSPVTLHRRRPGELAMSWHRSRFGGLNAIQRNVRWQSGAGGLRSSDKPDHHSHNADPYQNPKSPKQMVCDVVGMPLGRARCHQDCADGSVLANPDHLGQQMRNCFLNSGSICRPV